MSLTNGGSEPQKRKKAQKVNPKTAERASIKSSNTNKPKKKKPKQQILNEEDGFPLSAPEKNNIDQLIAQTLLRYKKEQQIDAGIKHKEIRHLALMCEEYLSTFTLIGYSLENEKIVIFSTPTAKDEAALVDLLRATFIDIANNRS
jgi:hypothetical protein